MRSPRWFGTRAEVVWESRTAEVFASTRGVELCVEPEGEITLGGPCAESALGSQWRCGVRDVHTGVVDLKGDRNRSSSCERWGFAGTVLRAVASQGCQGRGRVGAGIPYGTLLYSASLTCDPVAQQNRKSPFYIF